MRPVCRSAVLTPLLLLAVTFAPLLCRIGGDQMWSAVGRSATAAAAWTQPSAAGAPSDTEAGGPRRVAAPVAVAEAPKKCSGRHAPGPDESVPLPAQHRAEPLAPAAVGAVPLAADVPAQFALARPPTDGAPATDHLALLPVLRI
ncbi:hypothetical protein [Streptomyces celluloflavus]|uniref:hypothetical protein n=1 Tax=Streptomyces celluloflavus TaxID=58344 RepID=UPI0036CA2556